MPLLTRFNTGEMRLGRVEAFSDGVFAIIVTLLVLDLKVPDLAGAAGPAELGRRLVDILPAFLAWVISFVIVCKFWLNHSHVLSLARHADYGMIWLNNLFLMLQSFVPFPTALMGRYSSNPLAASFFGAVMAANTLLFIALHARVLSRLAKPELLAREDPAVIRKSFLGVASYLVGAAAAWINVWLAFTVYALTPLLFITPPRRRDARTEDAE